MNVGEELMAIEAARRLSNDTVCFVGIGLPSTAANLARRTHAPDCVLTGCMAAASTSVSSVRRRSTGRAT
jgi:acyl CoA:acetate/3-ketoacid CoA transferase beta subunit